MEVGKHTIQIVVKNRPDVLVRVAGIFSGRGFNIESITANVTMDPGITKINIVTTGDSRTVIKIQNQLKKLVDVRQVSHIRKTKHGQREIVLIRLKLSSENKDKIMNAIDSFKCRVLSRKTDHCIIEATGSGEEIDDILNHFAPLGMEDMCRSGIVAL